MDPKSIEKRIKDNEAKYNYNKVSPDDLIKDKWYRIGGPTDKMKKDGTGFIGKFFDKYEHSKPDASDADKAYTIRTTGGIQNVSVIPADDTDIIEELISEDKDDDIYYTEHSYSGESYGVGGRRRSYRKISSRKSKKSITSRRSRNSRKRRYSRRR